MDCFTLDQDNSIYPSATLFASVWFVGKLGKQDQNLLDEILKLSVGLGVELSGSGMLGQKCTRVWEDIAYCNICLPIMPSTVWSVVGHMVVWSLKYNFLVWVTLRQDGSSSHVVRSLHWLILPHCHVCTPAG